jgi:hypothetical protein
MAKSPDQIVADIDRMQNEEDLDLLPRAGRMLRDKVNEDLTGGAYVGSRLNMPSNTRLGKLNAEDTALLNKQDATLQGQKDAVTRMRKTNPEYFGADELAKSRGMKAGGKVSSASKRADGCCIRGKTRA